MFLCTPSACVTIVRQRLLCSAYLSGSVQSFRWGHAKCKSSNIASGERAMKILIRNALIVTMNEHSEVIERGSIVIDGSILSFVGPSEWMPQGPFDQTISADRMIAIPGMVNSHCHSPANLVRGMLASRPLEITGRRSETCAKRISTPAHCSAEWKC